MVLLCGRPSQLRDAGREEVLVGLRGGVGAGAAMPTVDSVGIADADFEDTCPGRRGPGRFKL